MEQTAIDKVKYSIIEYFFLHVMYFTESPRIAALHSKKEDEYFTMSSDDGEKRWSFLATPVTVCLTAPKHDCRWHGEPGWAGGEDEAHQPSVGASTYFRGYKKHTSITHTLITLSMHYIQAVRWRRSNRCHLFQTTISMWWVRDGVENEMCPPSDSSLCTR